MEKSLMISFSLHKIMKVADVLESTEDDLVEGDQNALFSLNDKVLWVLV